MIHILPQRRGCMLIYYSAQNVTVLVAFSADENSETLENSAINDGRSMFLIVLYMLEDFVTEMLKYD